MLTRGSSLGSLSRHRCVGVWMVLYIIGHCTAHSMNGCSLSVRYAVCIQCVSHREGCSSATNGGALLGRALSSLARTVSASVSDSDKPARWQDPSPDERARRILSCLPWVHRIHDTDCVVCLPVKHRPQVGGAGVRHEFECPVRRLRPSPQTRTQHSCTDRPDQQGRAAAVPSRTRLYDDG